MTAFAILETNVTAYPAVAEAKQAVAAAADSDPRLVVTSEAELASSPLSVGQLVEIWNGFAGVVPFDDLKPVKKFTDRKTAVNRIWRALQRLAPSPAREKAPPAPQAAKVAPKKARMHKEATAPSGSPSARPGTKTAIVLELLRRPEGATLAELRAATGWQPHSVRGFLSGGLGKKMGLTVESLKTAEGARAYRIKPQ
jgi:hypothetical protein